MDRGPWNVCMNNGRAEILSEDFNHDVMLRISGDWADNAQRTQYAEWLANELNECPRLRAENERLRAEVERLREDVEKLRYACTDKAERTANAALAATAKHHLCDRALAAGGEK